MDSNSLRTLAKPRWIIMTVIVLAVIAAFIRLGFWQLDRLAQRRANNAVILAHQNAPRLDLNTAGTPASPTDWQYRFATVTGTYDFAHQVSIGTEGRNGQVGTYLLTPLILPGSQQVVLVDRGWVPVPASGLSDWSQYNQTGLVTVRGMLMLPSDANSPLKPVANAQPVTHLPDVQLGVLRQQVPGTLLPVYLQASTGNPDGSPPLAALPAIDLSDGPHLNYAAQWFSFALIFAVGYPIFVRRSLNRPDKHKKQTTELAQKTADEKLG